MLINKVMKELIAEFTQQLKEALDITIRAELSEANNEIKNVVISGMGGSGIAGSIALEAIAQEIRIPVIVNKDYALPYYVNRHSLVVITSYSGDTEETIKAMEEAMERDAKIVCISTGGKISDKARKKDIDLIEIPDGMPPRAAIGYSIIQLLYVLNFFYIISCAYKKETQAAIKLLDAEEKNIRIDAKTTARTLIGKTPILYSVARMESVALRLRQQLNENAKILAWHNVFPELDHNELEGWKKDHQDIAVIIFRNKDDLPLLSKRIDISKDIIKEYTFSIKEIYSKGDTLLEKMLYLIHWSDWLSFFLAEFNETDTMYTQSINYLKSELAKQN
jgi:glucose/mannose-6-phosphate isomerase